MFSKIEKLIIRLKETEIIRKNKKILLIGPRSNVAHHLIGGATVSFDEMVAYFAKSDWRISVINTKRYFGFIASIRNLIYVLVNCIRIMPSSDIVCYNGSRGGITKVSPFVYLLAKIFKVKFVLRPFGGNFSIYIQALNGFRKWWFKKTSAKAELLLVQTKEMLKSLEQSFSSVYWLPTTRKASNVFLAKKRDFRKKFLYLGNIHPRKGILELIKVRHELPHTVEIHLHGPISNLCDEDLLRDIKPLYKGVIDRSEVRETMIQYDVLLLPTYYEGEGYPGVIVEAYSMGMPVVATNWKCIPEIVQDGSTGFLIEPKSVDALRGAILKFNDENYLGLSENSLQLFQRHFETDYVYQRLENQFIQLIKKEG